jgi:hypothetical protein
MCRKGLSHLCSLAMLSLMSKVMPSTKIYSMSKGRSLENVIFTLVIFINQGSPGVFRLGLINHCPLLSFGVTWWFLRGSCLETLDYRLCIDTGAMILLSTDPNVAGVTCLAYPLWRFGIQVARHSIFL